MGPHGSRGAVFVLSVLVTLRNAETHETTFEWIILGSNGPAESIWRLLLKKEEEKKPACYIILMQTKQDMVDLIQNET